MSSPNLTDLAYWRGAGGDQWARHNAFTERMFVPVTAALLDAAAAKPGEHVIDVGCGCGGLALAVARQVGPGGRVLGIDVSPAMLALARRLAPPDAKVQFVEADATAHAFDAAGFDLLISRHGVMFFSDPVRAFANLRRALKPDGRLVFSCFRNPRDNPWVMTPLQAAYRFVPPLPKPGPEDPGPFAFADEARVRRILDAAGLAEIALEPVEVMFEIAGGRGLDEAVANALEIGPTSRAVAGQDAATRARVTAAVREALAPHLNGDRVELRAALWLVTALNP